MSREMVQAAGAEPGAAQDKYEAKWHHGLERGRTLVRFLEEQGVKVLDSRALDIGCARGGISLAFAERAATVVGMDVKRDEVSRAAKRTIQGNSSKGDIHFGVASAVDLPLEPESFDIAVLIGVLEYMGLARPDKRPVEAQREALSEIARALEPGGALLLATENRWYPSYLMRSPHQRTWLAEGLPADFVRWVRRLFGWKPFWDRLHGHGALVRLVESAGFSDVDTFIPVYGYHFPKAIVGTDDRVRLGKVARRDAAGPEWGDDTPAGGRWGPFWFRIAAALGLQRLLVNSFVLVARKPKLSPS